ncbi:MAG: hypothetical protein COV72_00795 [Candidatus Omnitrophica bacterium CG11_big_fil_rev_8_21_14_0_20_42_13]|uniref:Galactosyldiacylglycerol synthase n=1 Tax=Candidatus Ghiorseimicrobium undicola TaxID=1974746 RepID=A0A2H0M2A7_9BACT|nr:MAG: hypothetical protein COV72_00795 [Candidatus Omnitrophica bacterium CG11_big_fil_rev_8_21_14_0_20_42_13]
MAKNILIAYISEVSGHRSAAEAVSKALKLLDPSCNVLGINLFHYTNPHSEKVINKLYNSIIKLMPRIWEYLYDNPKVVARTRKAKDIIHKFNSKKIKKLFDKFQPDVIACTQAFPCGMFADYKKMYNLDVPLIGVMTDFLPHAYWVYDNIDYYTVASDEARRKFIALGISPEKIKLTGIPIDPIFSVQRNKGKIASELGIDLSLPVVLVMGGGQGLGPIKTIIRKLDKMDTGLQVIVVTGTNEKLYKSLRRKRREKNILVLRYVNNIFDLMSISSVVISKPGGLTMSEALAKKIIPIIISPIPGQEENNTNFLLMNNAAFKAKGTAHICSIIGDLFANHEKYTQIQHNIELIARPNAALDVARLILKNV